MFEKEAEEYCGNLDKSKTRDFIKDAFKDGAEFGYNKANEWHDLRKDPNDLPKEHISVLVMLEYGVPYISFVSTDKRWFCTDYYTGEDKVIAWCEIPTFDKE